ncbi:MAG TPA: toll/interleukin-1 receptor domain-containing protein [Thermoanaerobaculia bacterium]
MVFISHSSRDTWIARMMAEKVSALGAVAWLDVKDLEGGDLINAKILEGLDACQEAVVLVSPNSVVSQWVVFEIGAALGQHKRVTPILNNASLGAIAPLKEIKAIDLNDFGRFLSELKKRIQKASEE